MKLRQIDLEQDYIELSQWFEGHGWEKAPDKTMLPKTGFVVEAGQRLMACGFLYLTNSPIAWLEWTATNPKEPEMGRMIAFKMLIQGVKEAAKRAGYVRIFQAMPNEKLASFYEKRLGFKKAEKAQLVFWGE